VILRCKQRLQVHSDKKREKDNICTRKKKYLLTLGLGIDKNFTIGFKFDNLYNELCLIGPKLVNIETQYMANYLKYI